MTANLVVGCGYLGGRVARLWLSRGIVVYALAHHEQHCRHLCQQDIRALLGDWNDRQSLPIFPPVETVLCSVGWTRNSARPIKQFYVDGLTNLLEALPDSVWRFIYISSTGVYGDAQGHTVNEESVCRPNRAGGHACLEAEHVLQHHALAKRAVILRLGGIYGPGRLPRLAALRASQPLTGDPNGLLNLVHVDDAARAIAAAATFPFSSLPQTISVVDGRPVRRRTFYEELARMLHLPKPRFAGTHAGPRDDAGSKRVSNRYLVDQLGFEFRYPSYREGLAQVAHAISHEDELQ